MTGRKLAAGIARGVLLHYLDLHVPKGPASLGARQQSTELPLWPEWKLHYGALATL